MAEMKSQTGLILIKAARPMSLLSGALTYFMGIGIGVYLGHAINWNIAFLGLACILFLLISSYYLFVYFDWLQPGSLYKNQTSPVLSEKNRALFLQIPLVLLATGAVLTVLLFLQIKVFAPVWLVLGAGILLAVSYGVPPLRLVFSGYGELLEAVLVCNLPPTLAFLLQTGDVHRLVAILSFPVTLLFMALCLAISLPDYAHDLKFMRKTLMVRMGWLNGMTMLNILILCAYLTLILSLVFYLPLKIALPAIITLPLGLFQVWQVYQISNGAKPHWHWLRVSAYALPILIAYLFTAATWMG